MSYQPEERYWTDYLRIALPVAGLLLMLGVFWVWANSLIGGNDSGKAPTATIAATVRTVAAPTATPGVTPTVVITPTVTSGAPVVPGAPTPTPPQGQGAAPTPPPTGAQPASSGSNANNGAAPQFKTDDIVLVDTDSLTLRDKATTSGNPVTTLSNGTELKITGEPTPADGYTWYPVVVTSTDERGYVAGEFLKANG